MIRTVHTITFLAFAIIVLIAVTHSINNKNTTNTYKKILNQHSIPRSLPIRLSHEHRVCNQIIHK